MVVVSRIVEGCGEAGVGASGNALVEGELCYQPRLQTVGGAQHIIGDLGGCQGGVPDTHLIDAPVEKFIIAWGAGIFRIAYCQVGPGGGAVSL